MAGILLSKVQRGNGYWEIVISVYYTNKDSDSCSLFFKFLKAYRYVSTQSVLRGNKDSQKGEKPRTELINFLFFIKYTIDILKLALPSFCIAL